jgi:5-methylcytosine-specific restriction endonuclease McrA
MSGPRYRSRTSPCIDASEGKVSNLVLNQYRKGSGYKDVVGRLYHFPVRYLNAFAELPSAFVYYEPREGGEQIYFGAGKVLSVYEDTEDVGHAYAEIGNYEQFHVPVDFYSKPGSGTWENAKTMRNSVRRISNDLFESILAAGGVVYSNRSAPEAHESVTESLQRELRSFPEPGKRNPFVLRKIRRILESYERPSAVTNWVKKKRGDSCQICGVRGFLKRDGTRYSEVHHLFHLVNDPPAECLSPEYLVVLCANCHRRMHYADVGTLVGVSKGWKVRVDADEILLVTREAA